MQAKRDIGKPLEILSKIVCTSCKVNMLFDNNITDWLTTQLFTIHKTKIESNIKTSNKLTSKLERNTNLITMSWTRRVRMFMVRTQGASQHVFQLP